MTNVTISQSTLDSATYRQLQKLASTASKKSGQPYPSDRTKNGFITFLSQFLKDAPKPAAVVTESATAPVNEQAPDPQDEIRFNPLTANMNDLKAHAATLLPGMSKSEINNRVRKFGNLRKKDTWYAFVTSVQPIEFIATDEDRAMQALGQQVETSCPIMPIPVIKVNPQAAIARIRYVVETALSNAIVTVTNAVATVRDQLRRERQPRANKRQSAFLSSMRQFGLVQGGYAVA